MALERLMEERKNWRKTKPFGFEAKPLQLQDGSSNLFEWSCTVPGREGTLCEGARYPCTIRFTPSYPMEPPVVTMPRGFFHVNVCSKSGSVCLSVLKSEVPSHLKDEGGQVVQGWKPSITVSHILLSLQELLHTPNFGSVLGRAAYDVRAKSGQAEYDQRTREQAQKYAEVEKEE
jgi:ubiquitin-conjugating enzyme E2 I